MIARFFLWLLGIYQRWISPMKRMPSCRFLPSCSAYAVEAIQVHGAGKGLLLAAWRLGRCHPFCRGGLDPVPPRRDIHPAQGSSTSWKTKANDCS